MTKRIHKISREIVQAALRALSPAPYGQPALIPVRTSSPGRRRR